MHERRESISSIAVHFFGSGRLLEIPLLGNELDLLPIDILALGELTQTGEAGLLGEGLGLALQVDKGSSWLSTAAPA
jgi:hypothetical protein